MARTTKSMLNKNGESRHPCLVPHPGGTVFTIEYDVCYGFVIYRFNCVEVCSLYKPHGLPCGSDGKASACNAGDPGSIPGSGRSIPWRKIWQTTPVLLPEKLHGLSPEEPSRRQSMESQRVGHN